MMSGMAASIPKYRQAVKALSKYPITSVPTTGDRRNESTPMSSSKIYGGGKLRNSPSVELLTKAVTSTQASKEYGQLHRNHS